MGTKKLGAGWAAMIAVLLAAACGDTPVTPDFDSAVETRPVLAADEGSSSGFDLGRNLLQWIRPLDSDVTGTKLCKAGQRCSVELRDINVFLTIPRGALADDTQIVVTALAGSNVNFEFGPHGTQFAKPVKVTVSTADTQVTGKEELVALYWILDESGDPVVLEEIPVKVFSGRLNFEPSHFSGYALAM